MLLEINNSEMINLSLSLYPKFQRRQNARSDNFRYTNNADRGIYADLTAAGFIHPTMVRVRFFIPLKLSQGNGSDVLINRAFRTAIKDEVALTLEKAENEILGNDVVNTIIQSKQELLFVDGSIEGTK
ncbi:hypothetical protein Dsin_013879 [Dipteronia sinensis]|uniref:Uncharacterized protein n=1 Tax=Dipteronia sinensis TaxID=43782 RepID=A0AAE0E9I6_9ROSI|nr:hypothetical protein Dsin_013879 [Dipteronia sinensis]